jgi:hypothetical protein
MESFRWLAITFSMILGLGVTRVLSGVVAVLRSRRHATIDWIPLAWAAAIFVLQLQFWWGLIELAGVERAWALTDFLLVLGVPLTLFASAAFVLPTAELAPDESLADTFEHNRPFALACLSLYALLALLADRALFGLDGFQMADVYLGLEIVVPLVVLRPVPRAAMAGATLFYLALVLWSSWALSPKVY